MARGAALPHARRDARRGEGNPGRTHRPPARARPSGPRRDGRLLEPSGGGTALGRRIRALILVVALGIREVRSEPDTNLYVDVSVRLGEDWSKPAAVAAAPPAPAPKWWDVRRFLRRPPRPAPGPGATLADPAAARSGSASDK